MDKSNLLNAIKNLFGIGENQEEKINSPQELDPDLFLKIITFSESDEPLMLTGGRRLRLVYGNDLYKILGPKGQISYEEVIKLAVRYAKSMYLEFERQAGAIDLFFKGHISFEISCALAKIYPGEDKYSFFYDIFPKSC